MSTSPTIILITETTSGIDYATVKAFSTSPTKYHIPLTSRNLPARKKAFKEIEQDPNRKGSLTPLHLSTTPQDSIDTAARSIEAKSGHLDVLINNTGIADTTLLTGDCIQSIPVSIIKIEEHIFHLFQ